MLCKIQLALVGERRCKPRIQGLPEPKLQVYNACIIAQLQDGQKAKYVGEPELIRVWILSWTANFQVGHHGYAGAIRFGLKGTLHWY